MYVKMNSLIKDILLYAGRLLYSINISKLRYITQCSVRSLCNVTFFTALVGICLISNLNKHWKFLISRNTSLNERSSNKARFLKQYNFRLHYETYFSIMLWYSKFNWVYRMRWKTNRKPNVKCESRETNIEFICGFYMLSMPLNWTSSSFASRSARSFLTHLYLLWAREFTIELGYFLKICNLTCNEKRDKTSSCELLKLCRQTVMGVLIFRDSCRESISYLLESSNRI